MRKINTLDPNVNKINKNLRCETFWVMEHGLC